MQIHAIKMLGKMVSFVSVILKSCKSGAGMRTRIAQVVERRARNPEVRGSNPGSGSNFSLEIL